MNADISFTQQGGVGVITLSRLKALNALSFDMIRELYKQLILWNADSVINAILIHSASPVAFCAGGDVRWLYTMREHPKEQTEFFSTEYALNLLINNLSKPYIALLDGVTFGGGVGISLHGSYPVATKKAQLALPETAIGFFPDIGASYLLNQLPGKLGVYLALTGERLSAEEALQVGLVRYLIAPTTTVDQLISGLNKLDWSPSNSLDNLLNSCSDSFENDFVADINKINHFFQYSSLTRIMDELSESSDPWAQATLKKLQHYSPLSLAITFALLEKTKGLMLEACLKVDYTLATNFMRDSDFYEGVRALLIDKDKKTSWKFKDVSEIPEQLINDYFLIA